MGSLACRIPWGCKESDTDLVTEYYQQQDLPIPHLVKELQSWMGGGYQVIGIFSYLIWH